jgi:hypothetical protein
VDAAVAEQRKTDDWQRMKECAEQAARLMKQSAPAQPGYEDSWSNHYSPKYGRCYVLSESKSKGSAWLHMGDAFEGSTIAVCVEASLKRCVAPGIKDDDCDACRRYIDDHMNN